MNSHSRENWTINLGFSKHLKITTRNPQGTAHNEPGCSRTFLRMRPNAHWLTLRVQGWKQDCFAGHKEYCQLTELAPQRARRYTRDSCFKSVAARDARCQIFKCSQQGNHSQKGGRTHLCHVKWFLSLFSTLQANLNWPLAYDFLFLSSSAWMLTLVLISIFMGILWK